MLIGRRAESGRPEAALRAWTLLVSIEPDSAYVTDAETLEIWNADTRGDEARPLDIMLFVQG